MSHVKKSLSKSEPNALEMQKWTNQLEFFSALSSDLQAGAKLVLNRQFADERWTKNRVVTCLDWSPQVGCVCFIYIYVVIVIEY